jgi:predicted RNA polymerase sigma factor
LKRCSARTTRSFAEQHSATGNAADAEDVLQDVFVKLIQGRPSKDFNRNPKGYLYRAAINSAVSIIRSRESRKLADHDIESVEIPESSGESGDEDDITSMRLAMANMKPVISKNSIHRRRPVACFSCRLSVVVVQHAAQSLASSDRSFGSCHIIGWNDQPIAEPWWFRSA